MNSPLLSYLVEADELYLKLGHPDLCIVDLGPLESYREAHIPGAVYLDPGKLRMGKGAMAGLLPDLDALKIELRNLGINKSSHVLAYDHENSAEACRMLWVLESVSQSKHSLLNGGMTSWSADSLEVSDVIPTVLPGNIELHLNPHVIADKNYVLDSLRKTDIQILDARSLDEFIGEKSASDRKGHIPGAINLNWLDTIDNKGTRKLKPDAELEELVRVAGFDRAKEIIVHCQTHRRSSHSFVMLRHLGFSSIRGYAGSWAEWAEDNSLPIE